MDYGRFTKHGRDIEMLPTGYYDWEKFQYYLIRALGELSSQRTWKTTIIGIPADNILEANDQILSSVFVVRRKIEVKITDCQKNFNSWIVDGWPFEEDYYISGCSRYFSSQLLLNKIPLNLHYWSENLHPAKEDTIS